MWQEPESSHRKARRRKGQGRSREPGAESGNAVRSEGEIVRRTRECATETPAHGDTADAGGIELTLFVAGQTAASRRARSQVRAWLDRCPDHVVFEVIDVRDRPDLAEQERVLATPALLRRSPPPRRKLVGDLGDWDTVVRQLDLTEEDPS